MARGAARQSRDGGVQERYQSGGQQRDAKKEPALESKANTIRDAVTRGRADDRWSRNKGSIDEQNHFKRIPIEIHMNSLPKETTY